MPMSAEPQRPAGARTPGLERWLFAAAVLPGVLLRLVQFAANPSLWVDEAAVARNVLDRAPTELLGPLDFAQVAPPGFLLGVDLSAALFGTAEPALRLVPLLAGLASLPLFWLVARAVLGTTATFVATAFVSLAVPLAFFSVNLKQYSTDVAATLALLALALAARRGPIAHRRLVGIAVAALALLALSQAAVFAAAAAALALALDAALRRPMDRAERTRRFGLAAVVAVAATLAVRHGRSLLSPLDDLYLHRFWSGSFPPLGGRAPLWLATTVRDIFGSASSPHPFDGALHLPAAGGFAALALVGAVALWRRAPFPAALVTLPIALAIAAAAVRAYPFGARVGLFLVPLFVLLAIAGAERLGALVPGRAGRLAPLALLPLAVAPIVAAPPPWRPEHLRPVLERVAERSRPGDASWVYYGAGQAFAVYSRRLPLRGEVHLGTCDRADPRDVLQQVDALRGRPRVWIVLAHGSGPFGFDERGLLLRYLDSIGHRRLEISAPPGDDSPNRAAAYLFDLSDPARLHAAAAQSFPIAGAVHPRPWTCYGTMSPAGPSPQTLAALRAGS